VTLRCTACGKDFSVKDYIDEMDEETWEKIPAVPATEREAPPVLHVRCMWFCLIDI
jgi:hypothetical protein